MTDRTHPDSGFPIAYSHYATYAEYVEALHARIAELEAQLESIGAGGVSGPLVGQPQAMPDLSALTERGAKAWAGVDAQGLRDGAASAGSEPVAWRYVPSKVWGDKVFTDDPARADDARQAGCIVEPLYTHPSPPEGMVGGWRPIETAPKEGVFLVYMQDEVRPARRMEVAKWHPNVKTVGGLFSFDCATVTHWTPLPPPPTTSAGSGKGE